MSIDIIQFIRRPKGSDMQTDFPAIAFRSCREKPIADASSTNKNSAPACRGA